MHRNAQGIYKKAIGSGGKNIEDWSGDTREEDST